MKLFCIAALFLLNFPLVASQIPVVRFVEFESSLKEWKSKLTELKSDQKLLSPKYRGRKKPLNHTVAEMEEQCNVGESILRHWKSDQAPLDEKTRAASQVLQALNESFTNVTSELVME